MSSQETIVVAFDLYGTLLSTASIAEELAKHFGKEKAQEVATLWRRYQLEYTWRLNSMNIYEPFFEVTRKSLGQSLAESDLELDEEFVESLMKAYDSLSTFPDVLPALESVSTHTNITAVVFSNGTDEMVGNSVRQSPDLSPHASKFSQLVTVGQVKKFKPHADVYFHLAKTMGKGTSKEEMGKLWLVSGNPFDVVGARSVGMQAAWVDRGGNGWTDRMIQGDAGAPTFIGKDLKEIVNSIASYTGQ
ncbi:MAG: hypothetical protein MMC33_006228 [Icmadophila ericetorum]|nr:hypothetical protein [Icmadophila ericetorum]